MVKHSIGNDNNDNDNGLYKPQNPGIPSKTSGTRSGLLISVPMGWFLIILGYATAYFQTFFAGVSIFFTLCINSWTSNMNYLGFYSYMSFTYNIAHLYLSYVFTCVSATYTMYAYKMPRARIPSYMFLISTIMIAINIVLSFILNPQNQSFEAMNHKWPRWWTYLSSTALDNWSGSYYLIFKIIDIIRTCFITLASLLFIAAHNLSIGSFYYHFQLL